MDKLIQMEFDFAIDTSAIAVAEKEAKGKRPIRFPVDAVPITAVDWETGVLLDKGKHGLKATPLSMNAMQKLMMMSKTGDAGEDGYGKRSNSYVDGLLTYESLMNFGGIDSGSPIVTLFNNNGLDVVMTRAAHSYLDRKLKQYKKMMTPFSFFVPEQFTKDEELEEEIQDDGGIEGPFVEEVYADEMDRYYNKITELGFDDTTQPFYLHPFQIKDVARAACKRVAFIGHEQGLGKTPMSIALCHMHGHKRILVVCPGPAIGSYKSGWRHEIHRMGVPKSNIHIMKDAEDLPFNWNDKEKYPDNGRPHFFLTDYGTMSKDIKEWNTYDCPVCGHLVAPTERGKCQGPQHPTKTTKRGKIVFTEQNLSECPICPAGEDSWTGTACDVGRGGCGWRRWTRVVGAGRTKKGITNPKPMWKRIKRNMFQVGLFDESQMAKNAATKRGHAVQHIPGLKRTYIITGTMMTNYVEDTFWQLNMLFKGHFPVNGQLKDYSTCKGHDRKKKFLNDFQATLGNDQKIPELRNAMALWGMMSSVQLRRRATDPEVDKQIHLPNLRLHTELVEMDDDHKMVYDMKTGDFQRRLLESLRQAGDEKTTLADLNVVECERQINILRMIAAAPECEPVYRRGMTNKDARIIELINEEAARGGKTVVFSGFRAFTEKLEMLCEDRNYKPIMIDGTIPIPKRWPMIDDWRTEPDRKVMIAGIRAMNYAVNFTAAVNNFDVRQVIFATPEWVPTEMEQAWKRVHRIGQNKDVDVYFVYFKNSVEQRMDEVLYQKRRTIASTIDRVDDLQRADDITQRSAIEIAKLLLNLGENNE